MGNIYIDRECIVKALAKLSLQSGPGPDGIPPHCIKYGGDIILEAVVDLARSTLEEGWVPDPLKGTWITPIWKGSDREDPSDYRPISITNHNLEVIERIIRKHILDFPTF